MADETLNGHDKNPGEFATFRIGGRDLRVPALTLFDLEQSRNDMRYLGPSVWWTEYAAIVLRIVARKLNPMNDDELPSDHEQRVNIIRDAWMKSCSVGEAQNITTSFNELLRVSGFEMADTQSPLSTESPGTGTLTESPPNSPLPSTSSTSDTSNEP